MGIKDLNKLVNRFAAAATSQCDFDILKKKTIAVDGFGFLFSYKIVHTTIEGYMPLLYDLFTRLRQNETGMIFVLDGRRLPEKQVAHIDRQQKKDRAKEINQESQQKLIETKTQKEKFALDVVALPDDRLTEEHQSRMAELDQEIAAQEKRISYTHKQINTAITSEDLSAVSALLHGFGFDVARSEHEGEAGCVKLALSGKVDYVVTNDADAMCFGDCVVIQNFNKPNMRLVDTSKVRELMGFSREEFVDLGILCGCDFSEKLQGLASVGAYKQMQAYRSIEKVMENCPQFAPPTNGRWLPAVARGVFLTMPCSVEFLQNSSNEEQLRELFAKYAIKRSVDKMLGKEVAEQPAPKSPVQMSLQDFFTKSKT